MSRIPLRDMQASRKLILLRTIARTIPDPFADDADFEATNTFPAATNGDGAETPVGTATIPRSIKSVRFGLRFLDADDAPVPGTCTLQAVDKAQFEYKTGFQVLAGNALAGVGALAPIQEVQETEEFSVRVTDINADPTAVQLLIYIQGYEYETGVDK